MNFNVNVVSQRFSVNRNVEVNAPNELEANDFAVRQAASELVQRAMREDLREVMQMSLEDVLDSFAAQPAN